MVPENKNVEKKCRGYGFSRPASGSFVPQRIQNLIIRNYAESNNLTFVLSAFEYYMDGCYMMLEALLEKINEVEGIIFYSLDLLPESEEHRKRIYKKILGNGKELHFALENLKITTESDLDDIEEIVMIKGLTNQSY